MAATVFVLLVRRSLRPIIGLVAAPVAVGRPAQRPAGRIVSSDVLGAARGRVLGLNGAIFV